MSVKNERRIRKPQRGREFQSRKVAVQEGLDTSVDRRPDFVQPLQPLVVRTEQPLGIQ